MWHGTLVAAKILKVSNAIALGDFRSELEVLRKVHHPNAVQFLGACTRQEPYVLVTELMTGGSLADAMRLQQAFTVRRAMEMCIDTARGLAYMHNKKPSAIIHRDLKPGNLMISGSQYHSMYELLTPTDHPTLFLQPVKSPAVAVFPLLLSGICCNSIEKCRPLQRILLLLIAACFVHICMLPARHMSSSAIATLWIGCIAWQTKMYCHSWLRFAYRCMLTQMVQVQAKPHIRHGHNQAGRLWSLQVTACQQACQL